MYFNNLIGRPTYEKEHLNLGKTGDSHKTNPSQLRRVSRPAPTARENTWQTNETNHAYVGVKRAAGSRLTYEKRAARLQKTSHSYKTNHPGLPHVLPPMSQMTTFFAYMLGMTGLAGDLTMTRCQDANSRDTILHKMKDQACHKSGIMSPNTKGYGKMGEVDLPLWRAVSDILFEERSCL